MKQLIDKSAVVAEIDALQNNTMDKNGHFLSSYHEGIFDGLSKIETFIDTLEVKEMDSTDAFIDKTEKWLKGHVLEYVPEMNFGVWKTDPDYYTKHFIEDYKKHMKGE